MSLRNRSDRWGPVSQFLHWTIVLLIVVLATAGLIMVELPKTPRYFWVYDLHKSTGLTLLALVLVRLAWRAYAGRPAPVAGTPRWQERVAGLTHAALYLLILAMPISGWLYDSASGLRPLRWFGTFDVPKLVGPDDRVRELALSAHEWLFWVLLALVITHAAAATYHHLFRNDDTLARMLPRGWVKPRNEETGHV
ncbi:MAG: cytochrome b [Pseudomonadota bacterium]|nr:cytochrome b [Pseudomonadota bacterium]